MNSLIFLGTGTSTGIPEIGCQCNTCTSPDPRDKRTRCSAYIHYGGEHILIDSGPDLRHQLLREGVDVLDRILITHEHYDHTGGLDDIRPLFWRTNYCPIHAEPNVIEALRRRMPYAFGEIRYPGVPQLHAYPVTPLRPIHTEENAPIIPLRVMHGKLPIVGYKLGNMAWITDAKVVPEETIQELANIPLLVINALRHYDHPAHMTLEEALQVIEKIAPQQAYLIHFAHTFGRHEEIATLCPPNVAPAYDGLRVEF